MTVSTTTSLWEKLNSFNPLHIVYKFVTESDTYHNITKMATGSVMFFVHLAFGLMHPFVGSFLCTYFMVKGSHKSWYQTLSKPRFMPPNWLVMLVWNVWYLSMGYAAYLVWFNGGGFSGSASFPLMLHITQMLLVWLWPVLFFQMRRTDLAVFDVTAVWILVFACVFAYRPISLFASLLMLPYLAWLSFEVYLSVKLWFQNPPSAKIHPEDFKDIKSKLMSAGGSSKGREVRDLVYEKNVPIKTD